MRGSSRKRATSRRKTKKSNYDVYSDDENKPQDGSKGGSSMRGNFDDVEGTNEYHVDHIPRDQDEDIDDDEAFNDEDEEKYGEFFVNQTGAFKQNKRQDGDILDESDSEEELDENDDEEFMDVSEMLAGNTSSDVQGINVDADSNEMVSEDDSDTRSSSRKMKQTLSSLMPQSESCDSSDESSISDDVDSEMSPDSDHEIDEDPEDSSKNSIVQFIETLDQKKDNGVKRKQIVQERTEAYDESEFSLNNAENEKAVALEDLMGVLKDTTAFGGLKKQLDILESRTDKGGLVAKPLPKRAVEEITRDVAYSKAKTEVKKWAPIVQKNRMADSLSFPLNAPGATKISSGELVGKFEPTTDLEMEVQQLLEDGNLTEKKQTELEDLSMNKLSKEEVQMRRAELAKMRSLMFFEEQKRKKISKIKSKTYHKILKRAKKNKELDFETLQEIDPEAATEKLKKMEMLRIKERISLKHKNTGKWAKQMLAKKDMDIETRRALMDQLAKHDDLKRKIAGVESSDEELMEYSGEQSDGADEQGIIDNAVATAEKLQSSIENTETPTTGVFSMKFMQRAVKEQKEQAKQAISSLKEDLLNGNWNSEDDHEDKRDESVSNPGRKSYGPKVNLNECDSMSDSEMVDLRKGIRLEDPVDIKTTKQLPSIFKVSKFGDFPRKEVRLNPNSVSVDALLTEQSTENEAKTGHLKDVPSGDECLPRGGQEQEKGISSKIVNIDNVSDPETSENPWLRSEQKAVKKSLRHPGNISSKGKHEKALEKLAQTRKDVILEGSKRSRSLEDAVILNVDQAGENEISSQTKRRRYNRPKNSADIDTLLDTNDMEETGSKTPSLIHKDDIQMMCNSDIMQLAFGDDGVMDEFQQEKDAIIEEDRPKDVDLTLPGWGAWAGSGLKARENVVVKKAKQGEGVDRDRRKDAGLKNVIINEKKSRKNAKYVLNHLPHGFENKEQYEKTIRMPLGKEWHAFNTHQQLVKPRVTVKEGCIIQPLSLGKKLQSAI